jgi:hypothetical protein
LVNIKKRLVSQTQTGIWAITLGSTGFICGFFGPMLLNPSANLGPLLGLFLSGPISMLLGVIFGRIFSYAGLKGSANILSLVGASLIVATVTLAMSLPAPSYVGFVVDAEVRGCKQPRELIADRVAWWNKTQDSKEWSKRPGWEDDLSRMINKDAGVVLDMWVYRERKLFELRKPWNRGRIEATAWSEENKPKKFYSRFSGGSCSEYIYGTRKLYSPLWETSAVSPPDILPTFLGLYVLQDVPAAFRSIIE